MEIRSRLARAPRLIVVCLVAVLGLALTAPAQAHHKDSWQTTKIKKLLKKAKQLTNDGTFYSGSFWAFNGFNFDCADQDAAKFYDLGDNLFYLDCESIETASQSVDAMTTNAAATREQRLQEARERIPDLP